MAQWYILYVKSNIYRYDVVKLFSEKILYITKLRRYKLLIIDFSVIAWYNEKNLSEASDTNETL